MIDDKFFNLFDESLKLVSSCPVCQRRYNPVEIKVLAEKNNSHLIYIKCQHCSTAILAVILVNNLGVNSIGLITDLNSDEILKFKEESLVDCDDVLEIHQALMKDKVLIDQLI